MFLITYPLRPCAVFKLHRGGLAKFRWCIARGKHLFPFRTEQLSLSAPMVLGGQPPGRVGRRRFFFVAVRWESDLGSAPGGVRRCGHRRRRAHGRAVATRPPPLARQGWVAKRSIAERQVPVLRVQAPGRCRLSQGRDGASTGSRPYSPRVAKSIARSAASARRVGSDVFVVSNIGSTVRGGPDGSWRLQAFLQPLPRKGILARFLPGLRLLAPGVPGNADAGVGHRRQLLGLG
jgi:hypothetical protein